MRRGALGGIFKLFLQSALVGALRTRHETGVMAKNSYLAAGAFAVFGVTCVVVGDTAGKVLVQDGVTPLFVAWTRFAIAAVLILPLSGLVRDEVPAFWDWRLVMRALFVVAGISCILTALRTETIANVFGAFFIGPVVAFVLGALILREGVTVARALALAVGFAGVMLVVKPGFGMTPGLGLAVLAGVSYGCYLVATRWLAPMFRPRLMLATQLVVGAVALAPLGLAAVPAVSSWAMVGLLVLSALGSAAGNFVLVTVSRTLPAGILAPLVYSQLISATILGWLVFGDWPDAVALSGLVLILASGMASLMFAQRRG